MPQRIVSELELKRHGYDVSIISPDYFVPFPDGTSLTLWGDMARDRENIGRLSAHDAEAWVAFDAYFERVAKLLKDLLFVVPPNMRLAEAPRWAKTAGRFRGWTGRDIHELVRLFTMSAADFLDEWFDDERVKGALATQAIIGAWCGPMTPGSAYVLMHHWIGEVDGHFGAWGWVKGGMGGVSRAMASAAQEAGATVRTDAPVSRIAVNSHGRAVGVELDDGSLVRARAVVSNAHPTTTYLDLVGEEQLPADVVRDIRRYRTRSGSVKINIGLSDLPTFSAWDQDGDVHRRSDRDVAVDGVPGTRVRRCEVRQGVGASVRGGDVPHRARAAARSRRQAHHDGVHAVRAVRAARGVVGDRARCLRGTRHRRAGAPCARVCRT